MPIFHDPYHTPPQQSSSSHTPSGARQIPKSPATLSDALPHDEMPHWSRAHVGPHLKVNSAAGAGRKQVTLARAELIERLKRANSPLWHQTQDVERNHGPSPEPRPTTPTPTPTNPRPSPTSTPDPLRDLAAAGLEIERPRSALHSGDFREGKQDASAAVEETSTAPYIATSPVAPWRGSFPAPAHPPQKNVTSYSFDAVFGQEPFAVSRARAISQLSTGSFALLPPTSPLVQAANNTDIDSSSRPGSRQGSTSPTRDNRRHTYSPAPIHIHHTPPMARSISGTPAARHLRYGGPIPYQAHQPRRSMTFNQQHSLSSPQTPFLGARQPSNSSEVSPLQHAPMVGSYEESILRGRMSTTPSRPLDFVAKIGVLGKGPCKPSLKCPPHVTVPFPAVFYSYNTGNGRISDDEPSPYVGLIDLENSLSPPHASNESSRRNRRHAVPAPDQDDLDFRISPPTNKTDRDVKNELRKKEKRKRRSTSPKAPPGGSYRIPAQGQLQIVLKNPNNTAVKLFLVPYDLSDMEPGQKTFIRQRSYSAGPIIDMPTQSRKNLGTDRPEAALSNSEDPNDRPILRYLIHIHICSPSKDRYYLYKSIRVVFANRVPDGKEKLRNEIQLPEPKYSTYKPTRDSAAAQHASPYLVAEKSRRRRSAAWPITRSQQSYDQIDGLTQPSTQTSATVPFSTRNPISSSFNSPLPNLEPIPFSLTRLAAIESRPVSRDDMHIDTLNTPISSPGSHPCSPGPFGKLLMGPVPYGASTFNPVSSPTSPPSAGLLSQRLRGLEVQKDEKQ